VLGVKQGSRCGAQRCAQPAQRAHLDFLVA
jgi:hypothetical protein